MNWEAFIVFIAFFLLVTVLGFWAARWRRGNLDDLHEWGLAGRRFGTVVTWFLLGGDLYTAYTFIAVPAAMFGLGAVNGFFAVPYTVLVYPIIYVLMPRFWSVCKEHGYVTAADFVQGRFGSRTLALVVAFTGILATMPYIALQMFGIQVSLAALGIPISLSLGGFQLDIPLIIAFIILAAYTYTSGLRAPAMIALVKDIMIFVVLFVTIIYLPIKLGGFGNIFNAAHAKALATASAKTKFFDLVPPNLFPAYVTLAVGSAFALFLYPHALTGVLSSSSQRVVKRNTALLPIYSLMLGFLALLGYMAISAGINPKGSPMAAFGNNASIPLLINAQFPSWFAGFAFAAISIGALVPAAVMSIAAANLFTRNIYRAYFDKEASAAREARVAKLVSLIVKFGALVFIVYLPTQYVLNFQLLGGVWILQTLPAVFLGLYTRWFNRWALVVGWLAGMVAGTWMFIATQATSSVFAIKIGPLALPPMYSAFTAVILNLVLVVILTPVFQAIGAKRGSDETSPADYTGEEVSELVPEAGKEALG